MPGRLVFQIQRIVLSVEVKPLHAGSEGAVELLGAALAAIRLEVLYLDAQRSARSAAVAMWFVSEQAAAAKAHAHQFTVDVCVD